LALIKKIREYKYDVVIDVMGATGCTPSMYLMASSIANEKITIINNAYSICHLEILYNILLVNLNLTLFL